MIIVKYVTLAAIFSFVVVGAFVFQFYFRLGYELSNKPSDWVDFSDYIGGLLGPIFSFLSFILLLHSIKLQGEANIVLKNDVAQNYKNERFRVFESHFFNLIDAQRIAFSNFKYNNGNNEYTGTEAVIKIEDEIFNFRNNNTSNDKITEWLEVLDEQDQIHNVVRVFTNLVKMICSRLSNDNGFDKDERKEQLTSLINLTEYAQLRLIAIAIRFMDAYHPVKYLLSNEEFMSVIKEMKLSLSEY
ncbi:hypothetical protein GBN32_13895 [Plesiomonas shigelloides]|uniref:hypothetical protein n=1 Tax=Plesiomonas shigelloides TaxID=703 RepID=UPI00126278DA|nr:hypothetical protein [Plesiomonas shigelloides]KAB7708439.1 hypothetical protein GBN32_13895 [Plesiomonas shigelloides]